MKKKMGALCTAESTTRPSTSGTTTAAAMRAARPRSSIPDGPCPAEPRSPAGDIPTAVYRSPLTGCATHEELPHHAPQWSRDAPRRGAHALAEDGRQDDDHQHDHHRQDPPVAEHREPDGAQDA